MSDPQQAHEHHDIRVPKGALIGAGLLILFTISTVGFFRLTGQDPTAMIPQSEQVLEARELKFEDGANGSVIVYESVMDGEYEVIHEVPSGEGGFIRGVLRSLARARNASGISRDHPFLLEAQTNGTLVLEDPQTGQRIDLKAFGPSNIAAFRALFQADEAALPNRNQASGNQDGAP